jgi:putative flippase GtrA
MLRSLRSAVPGQELFRYLLVGAWNTLFGYGCFAGLTALLADRIPESYIAASLISNVISITVSFLGYKWFVFRTKGNYLSEWVRCLGVYSFSMAFSLLALPAIVLLLRYYLSLDRQAPYIAGAIVIGLGVLFSFFGHKYFSFKTRS